MGNTTIEIEAAGSARVGEQVSSDPERWIEGLLLGLLAVLATIAFLGLWTPPGGVYTLALFVLALCLWGTARRGLKTTLFALPLPGLAVLLATANPASGRPPPPDLSVWTILAAGALSSLALDVAIRRQRRTREELRVSVHIQGALHGVLQLAIEPLSLQAFLERTLDHLFAVPWLGLAAQGSVFLKDETSETLVLVAQRALPESLLTACDRVEFGHCLCGRAAARRETIFASSVDHRHETHYAGMGPHGHYCVPIRSDDEVLGVLNLYVGDGCRRSAADDQFLEAVAGALASVVRRRRAEEALRKSEERFLLAVKGTGAGIWDWNIETNEVYFSPRWKSMLGFEDAEITNTFREWEQRVHPDDLAEAFSRLEAYLEGRRDDYEVEHRLLHKDGSYRWILSRGATVRTPDGRPTRMVGSHLDITAHRLADETLREQDLQLRTAESIQRRLLPASAPSLPGYDIGAILAPAEYAAGDDYDYLDLGENRLGIVVSDVSGHGLGPALLMASAQTLMRMLALTERDPGRMLERANAFLHAETSAAQFVSMLLLELDPTSGRVRYANAGHPPAYLLGLDGRVRERLQARGPALSILEDATFVTSPPLTILPGETILLVTDGVTEARSPDGTYFGEDRALEIVRGLAGRPAHEVAETLQREVRLFTEGPGLADDVTVVVLKRDCEAARRPGGAAERGLRAGQAYSG